MGDMDILRELRESGLKVTIPRLRILQLFQEGGIKHLSADDVYKLLLAEKIDVGLATIYRVLMQFAEAGILFRRHFESGHAVFELNEGQHHDHLVCTGCGKVDEFVDEGIELRQNEIATERGFVLHEHALSLYGTCAECTAKKVPPRKASCGSAQASAWQATCATLRAPQLNQGQACTSEKSPAWLAPRPRPCATRKRWACWATCAARALTASTRSKTWRKSD